VYDYRRIFVSKDDNASSANCNTPNKATISTSKMKKRNCASKNNS